MGLAEGAMCPVQEQSPIPLGFHRALLPLAWERS